MPTRKGGAELHGHHGDRRASMGPRRCRRGREFATAACRSKNSRFNGAASLPTRKVEPGHDGALLTAGFNGAASLPTRKG